MPLRVDNFVAFRSNWSEKSNNIQDLAETLNLGLDAFVFIDDNPFEIEEVRTRLPGVECYLFDRDKPEAALALLGSIASLRARSVTAEDLAKTAQYRTETQRSALQRRPVAPRQPGLGPALRTPDELAVPEEGAVLGVVVVGLAVPPGPVRRAGLVPAHRPPARIVDHPVPVLVVGGAGGPADGIRAVLPPGCGHE